MPIHSLFSSVLGLLPLAWPLVGQDPPKGGEALAWVTLVLALGGAGAAWYLFQRRG